MTDKPSAGFVLDDYWKLLKENPWTQQWVMWSKWAWATHPMSKLIPLDPEEIWKALIAMGDDLAARPELLEERTVELLRSYNELVYWTLRREMGQGDKELAAASKKDGRFADEAWSSNMVFSALKQSYLILSNWMLTTAERTDGLDPKTRQRMLFYVRQFVDSLSPANFWMTNPVALRETLNSGGENLRRGMQNLLDDIKRGDISTVGHGHFKIGENLALSPGQVVFRNELIEIIQYEPKTEQVHRVPLLVIPPWINKYYILDLRPGRSLVEYMVGQGYTIFMVSWRNAPAALQGYGMEDYMRLGPLTAVRVVKAITESRQINMLGYCIGGTLLAMQLAYYGALKDESVISATFFTALQDFTEVGEQGVFVSEQALEKIEKWVHPKGYVDAIEMNTIFKLMRDNDLMWNFVVNNYLMGKEPLNFDLLFWSSDGVRMPRRFHSEYLRTCYLDNCLITPNKLRMLGQGIDLSCIKQPTYIVTGLEDHIVPWRSAYRLRSLISGPSKVILGSGGHIGSVVSPVSTNKGMYYTNDSDTTDPAAWLSSAKRNDGSWWPDWAEWLRPYSGELAAPPSMGNAPYTPLIPAPGTYVVEP